MLGFCASYIKSLTLIFNPLMPELSPWLVGLITIVLILALSLKGGLTSIIRLDQISFIFILLFIPFLVYKSNLLSVSQHISISQGQQILTPGFVLSLIGLTMFSYILAPWYGQKIVSAQNKQTARLAVIIAAIIITLFYSGGIVAVYALKKHGVVLANSDTAFPYLIKQVLPHYTQGIAYAALFTIGATTIAGVWSSMVTLIVGELQVVSNSLQRSYILTVITAFLCYIIANTLIDNILNKMILANIPIVATAFALLAGFYWPRANNIAAYASLAVGIVWGVICYITLGDAGGYTRYWAFYGIPLIFITGIIVTLISTKKTKLHRMEK